jgi:DNA polymerase-3 subunit alpha
MTYRLVQAYTPDGDEIEFEGRAFPAICLVEDVDGIRLLLIPSRTQPLPLRMWAAAHADGAQALVSAFPVAYVLADDFVAHREAQGADDGALVIVPDRLWTSTNEPPRYASMVLRREEEPALPPVTSFVNLHVHTEFSSLDGLATLDELATAARENGQQALAVTDHGTCAAHPALQKAATSHGLRPIFGMEAYFVENRRDRPENQYDYWHLVLWAMDDEGLRNLWAMSTESYRDGFHGKPRLDWSTLQRLGTGVMASTACLGGPLLDPWKAGNEELAVNNLLLLKSIFEGRLYIELHANHLEEQIPGNKWLIELAEKYEVPLIAVADSHYARRSEKQTHQDWLSVALNKDVRETNLFQGNQDYHLMNEAEMRHALSYLPQSAVDEAILNTAIVANRCTAEIRPNLRNPIYSRASDEHPDRVQHDVERLTDACLKRWEERTVGKPHPQSVYIERFEKEMGLLIPKGFCGYFLMVSDLVAYAKEIGILVGPGRGSGGGSLVAYLCGITEIDPVENDLLFERFMTEGRTELPDFDIDFPSSKKMVMFEYAAQRWHEANVATVGTHMRMKNKSTVKGTAQALRDRLPDDVHVSLKAISKIIDDAEAHTAGLGLSWDDLWAQAGDLLEPYRDKYPYLFELAGLFHGRLRGYGKHPAGIIIDPDHPLTGSLPLRGGEDGHGMIAQFDLDALAELGYVKFDLLNISNLDTIQACVDLIEEQTGFRVNPYAWREEYHDPQIYEEMGEGWTLGIFQIGTSAGTREVKRFKPKSIAELADVITLVRPGPKRSGLTEIYFKRRSGEEEVTYADPRLEAILSKTYGTMLYQEDIMAVCMTLAGYDSNEADKVRKILGKKQVEKVQEAGEKFIRRAIENNTDPSVAASMWEQMAEFAKYSFNRAHACAYAIIGFWTAWLKFHYPVQFLCAALSTVDSDRIPDFVEEARRMGYNVLPPDINLSDKGFTAHGMNVRYGLLAVHGVGDVAVDAVLTTRPYRSWEHFLEAKTTKCNMGHTKALVRIGAFDSLEPNRRALEQRIAFDEQAATDKCRFKDPTVVRFGLPCTFDWESEPPPIGRTGKPLKPKPVPKKCTKACRQYSPVDPPDPATIEPYTEADIRDIEMEMLGVYLTSTPFDRISAEDKESLSTAVDVLSGPNGSYTIAAIIRSKRGYLPASGKLMGFLTVTTERGELDVVVFNDWWEKYSEKFRIGGLCLMAVRKNDRGHSLDGFINVDE